MSEYGLTAGERRLGAAARAGAARAYAPYSGFQVGAAVLGGSGQVYLGVNVENASYPVALCAERNAVGSAVTAGESEIRAVAVAGGDQAASTVAPCGMCRQFLAEFGPGVRVVWRREGQWVSEPVSTLLPSAFALDGARLVSGAAAGEETP